MAVQEEYKVQLEVFEGPLDLLLYLIRKDEVDIYDIPIESITSQYMDYLNVMKMLDLNIAGEFIVMAATLMLLKSRLLLPVEDRSELEEEEEDPRWELVRQLVEYKKFKDAAARLQDLERHQEDVFLAGEEGAVALPHDPGLALRDVSIFDLITAFNEVLKRAVVEEIGAIEGQRFNVADKIETILRTVHSRATITFQELFSHMASRNEIICTFLALLELVRLRHVEVKQECHFSDIIIVGTGQKSADLSTVYAARVEDPVPGEG